MKKNGIAVVCMILVMCLALPIYPVATETFCFIKTSSVDTTTYYATAWR